MKISERNYKILILVILCLPFYSVGQSLNNQNIIKLKLLKAAEEIMIEAGTCALITLDDKGRPRVRAMDPFPPQEDLVVWFGTNKYSRKVEQLKNDPRVTLYYLDHDATGYVMIHGIAQLVDNKEKKEHFWKEEWETFYTSKEENYLLIKVSPQWLEIISETRGIVGDDRTWEPQKVIFNKEH